MGDELAQAQDQARETQEAAPEAREQEMRETPEPPARQETPAKPPVPERYEIKVDGYEIDRSAVEAFAPVAREIGLTNEQANKLAAVYASQLQGIADGRALEYERQSRQWAEDTRADGELGGSRLQDTLASCRRALDAYDGNREFADLMDATGLGNHPAVIRIMSRVGRSLREDRAVGVGSGRSAPKPMDINAVLYGNSGRK